SGPFHAAVVGRSSDPAVTGRTAGRVAVDVDRVGGTSAVRRTASTGPVVRRRGVAAGLVAHVPVIRATVRGPVRSPRVVRCGGSEAPRRTWGIETGRF